MAGRVTVAAESNGALSERSESKGGINNLRHARTALTISYVGPTQISVSQRLPHNTGVISSRYTSTSPCVLVPPIPSSPPDGVVDYGYEQKRLLADLATLKRCSAQKA